MSKINEHVYRTGLRQRWYSSAVVAKLVLSKIPKERRGVHTLTEPLKTSPMIWRVDDMAKALTVDAKKTSKTVQAVALGIIADHYGIEVAAPQRGRPKSVESE